ncbi:MAG: ribonuclease H-like domain-containing protein, partial [Gorillibacterium sp.]|nr:ribonuclease H-like domain-containing protein [Gorillibacterium sp.]
MSGLRERLNRLKMSSSSSPLISPSSDESSLQELEETSFNEWAGLEAEYVENQWGAFVKRTRRYPLTHRHGCYELGEIGATGGKLAAFSAAVLPAVPESFLYFDTETTGLGHGAGNLAFMLGIGFYQAEEFVVEQLLIRNTAEELAMLTYFSELAAGFTHLVTYNGKAFDWPLLQGRCVMNRLKPNKWKPQHLDFLHPSRSLWKHTLPSCRLGKVEEERLGFNRMDDLPGAMAPVYYFRYLAERDPEILRGVFVHNEYDILSLASLSIHFSRVLSGLLELDQMVAEEVYRLGLWFDKMEEVELAEQAFQHLLNRSIEECAPYWTPVAAYYKKRKNAAGSID